MTEFRIQTALCTQEVVVNDGTGGGNTAAKPLPEEELLTQEQS